MDRCFVPVATDIGLWPGKACRSRDDWLCCDKMVSSTWGYFKLDALQPDRQDNTHMAAVHYPTLLSHLMISIWWLRYISNGVILPPLFSGHLVSWVHNGRNVQWKDTFQGKRLYPLMPASVNISHLSSGNKHFWVFQPIYGNTLFSGTRLAFEPPGVGQMFPGTKAQRRKLDPSHIVINL